MIKEIDKLVKKIKKSGFNVEFIIMNYLKNGLFIFKIIFTVLLK